MVGIGKWQQNVQMRWGQERRGTEKIEGKNGMKFFVNKERK